MIRRRAARDRRRGRPRGQALAELAVSIPVLLLVISAIFEAGAFVITLMVVGNAAQDGGRMAALPGTATEASVKNHVVSRAAFAPVSLNTSNVSISLSGCATPPCTFTTRESGDRVRVDVDYTYRPLIAMVFGNGTTFALEANAEFHVE